MTGITFKKFMEIYKDEDTPKGDLARDIFSDENFPATISYNRIFLYLQKKGACSECLETFDEAFDEYLEVRG